MLNAPKALFGSIGVLDDSTDAALYGTQGNGSTQGVYTVTLDYTLPKPAINARISFTLPSGQRVIHVRGAQIKTDGELVVLTTTLSTGRTVRSVKGSVQFEVKLSDEGDEKKVNSFQIAGL
jgi:hypothetical protein